MSPAPSGSLALQRIKLGDALEIRDAIIVDFYPGLPHTLYMQQLHGFLGLIVCDLQGHLIVHKLLMSFVFRVVFHWSGATYSYLRRIILIHQFPHS